jgi:hypothetical protein
MFGNTFFVLNIEKIVVQALTATLEAAAYIHIVLLNWNSIQII